MADAPGGGFLAPPERSTERLRSSVRMNPVPAAARVGSMSAGGLYSFKRTGTARWVGEVEQRSPTQPRFGRVEGVAHDAAALVDVGPEEEHRRVRIPSGRRLGGSGTRPVLGPMAAGPDHGAPPPSRSAGLDRRGVPRAVRAPSPSRNSGIDDAGQCAMSGLRLVPQSVAPTAPRGRSEAAGAEWDRLAGVKVARRNTAQRAVWMDARKSGKRGRYRDRLHRETGAFRTRLPLTSQPDAGIEEKGCKVLGTLEKRMVPRDGVEPPTLRFSVACSTN